MLKAPSFWQSPRTLKDKICIKALTPLGLIYGWVAKKRFDFHYPVPLARPVVCIGNITMGGTGKTPAAMAVCDMLKERGHNPHFLSRGYGGSEEGPLQVSPDRDTPADVGDEPLLLVHKAPTWISTSRPLGAQAAIDTGASVIIMDDGFQNPSLHKDFSLVVIDGGAGFGNKKIFPAGPLREDIAFGLSRADAVVIVGEDATGAENEVMKHTPHLPVFKAHLKPDTTNPDISGKTVFAFAGIGRPEKFRDSLIAAGAIIDTWKSFPDHFPYTETDLADFMNAAEEKGAIVLTTAKDHVRLPASLQSHVSVFRVEMAFDDPGRLADMLDTALAEH
ncbi:MAG: tetraacyldisaccharide 4'-kinase [Alphaproteobacteria bacterium]|nr:tetraacyldisaccharide 4'-kinase [Alphaproteobacteria bacterium]